MLQLTSFFKKVYTVNDRIDLYLTYLSNNGTIFFLERPRCSYFALLRHNTETGMRFIDRGAIRPPVAFPGWLKGARNNIGYILNGHIILSGVILSDWASKPASLRSSRSGINLASAVFSNLGEIRTIQEFQSFISTKWQLMEDSGTKF